MVVFVCGVAAIYTWALLPKLDYLPTGNRNLIFGYIQPPPGYNLETTTGIARNLEEEVRPLWASETGPESAPGEPPKIGNFFFVAFRGFTFVGAMSMEPSRIGELIPVLSAPIFREPGTFGFMRKRSLFGRGFSGGRTIKLNVAGPELEPILGVALKAVGLVSAVLPREEGTQLRPIPGLELGAPEVRLIPDQVRLADNGVSARELGLTVDAFNDGLRVAEITVEGNRIDLTLLGRVDEITRTQGIDYLPVVTQSGKILPTSSLANIEMTSGPTEILHVERDRTVTLEIGPPDEVPLEAALDLLRENVVAKLEADGLPPGVKLRLSGTADKLTAAWEAISLDLVIAVVIVYLVMAVLFESFLYPLIIVLSVPLATAGGIGGLALLNEFHTFQPLDMLTLLGFVILIGIVVNNAILLVHQTPLPRAPRGVGRRRSDTRGDEEPDSADFHVDADQRLWHGPSGAVRGRWLGALPRPRLGGPRRARVVGRADPVDHPAAAEPRHRGAGARPRRRAERAGTDSYQGSGVGAAAAAPEDGDDAVHGSMIPRNVRTPKKQDGGHSCRRR